METNLWSSSFVTSLSSLIRSSSWKVLRAEVDAERSDETNGRSINKSRNAAEQLLGNLT